MGAPLSVIRQTFVDWYNAMLSLALLNLLWLLSLVTVVLFPPATAALYAVANELARGESSGFSEFIEAGRRYFIKSWIWALMNVAVLLVIWSNIVFYGQQGTDLAIIVQTFFVILGVYWLVMQVLYFWPLMMEQSEKRVLMALRNSVLVMLASPVFTLVLVVFVVVLLVLSVVFVLPMGVMTIAVIALVGNHAVRNRLIAFGKLSDPNAPPASEAGSGDGPGSPPESP
mgnify:CR=1 FL=1